MLFAKQSSEEGKRRLELEQKRIDCTIYQPTMHMRAHFEPRSQIMVSLAQWLTWQYSFRNEKMGASRARHSMFAGNASVSADLQVVAPETRRCSTVLLISPHRLRERGKFLSEHDNVSLQTRRVASVLFENTFRSCVKTRIRAPDCLVGRVSAGSSLGIVCLSGHLRRMSSCAT